MWDGWIKAAAASPEIPRGGLPVQCRADTKDHAAGRGKGRTAVGAAGIVPDRVYLPGSVFAAELDRPGQAGAVGAGSV